MEDFDNKYRISQRDFSTCFIVKLVPKYLVDA